MKRNVWAIKVKNRYYYNSDTKKMAMRKYVDDQSPSRYYDEHEAVWKYARENVVKITIKEGWK